MEMLEVMEDPLSFINPIQMVLIQCTFMQVEVQGVHMMEIEQQEGVAFGIIIGVIFMEVTFMLNLAPILLVANPMVVMEVVEESIKLMELMFILRPHTLVIE